MDKERRTTTDYSRDPIHLGAIERLRNAGKGPTHDTSLWWKISFFIALLICGVLMAEHCHPGLLSHLTCLIEGIAQ